MRVRYPNLELLDYRTRQMLLNDKDYQEKAALKLKDNDFRFSPDLDVVVFTQIWGSTCTGFDICDDGSPAIGGCAMTKEFTIVFHELNTDIYLVFFGDRVCYKITDANDTFFNDLKARNLASLSEAKKKY